MSNIRHVTPFTDPYLVKTLFILPISFGVSLFSTFIFPALRELFFKLLLLLQQAVYSQHPEYFNDFSRSLLWLYVLLELHQAAQQQLEKLDHVFEQDQGVFHLAFSIFLLSILWNFFMTTNTLFLHPQIMTTLDSIFPSLQRGSSKQAARLCHDQLKQLIL